MSPEQATGDKQLDARSDIYSLGAVLYEMLAGEPPFTGPSVHAIIAKLLTEHPIRLRTVRDTVPGYVDAAVQRALATAPVDRFVSAAEFAAALDNPAGPTEVPRAGGRGSRVGVGLGVLALLGAAGWWVTQSRAGAQPLPELERVQLTFTGNASLPAVSPDGKRVAYLVRECSDFDACPGDIMITDVPATAALTVVRGVVGVDQIHWTSDGRFLTYTDYLGPRPGGYLVSSLGGSPRFVGEGSITQLGTSDTLVLAEGLGKVGGWLRVVPISGSTSTDSIRVPRLHESGWDVFGAPTGDRVAVLQYDDSTWSLQVVDRKGEVHDSLAGVFRLTLSVNWAPAGDALIVTVRRPDRSEWDVLRLPLGRPASNAPRVDTIARGLRLVQGTLSVGLTGTAAYSEERTEWSLHSFVRSAESPTNVRDTVLLSGTGPASGARVDPGGGRALIGRPIGSSEPPLYQLVVIPLGGGTAAPVGAPRPGGLYNWTADGKAALISEDGKDGTTLKEINPVTGASKTLGGRLPSPAEGLAGLTGGGVVASTLNGERWQLHVRGVPGRADTSIVPTPNGRYAGRGLLPRPDGLAVAVVSFPLDSTGVSMELLEVDILTGKTRVLARFPMTAGVRPADWTDNTHLDFFRPLQNGTGWYRLETTTGRITEVARISQPTGYYDLSADGRRGAALIVRQRSDIVLIPNFGERLK